MARPLARREGMAPGAPLSALRSGLTMVELLVTMSIVAMLASMVLMAMGSAQESARVARTKTLIATLHGIVMQQYDGYRTRRVPVDTSNMNPQAAAQQRLNAIRTLMLCEMPDRWSDVQKAWSLASSSPEYGTGLVQAYHRFYNSNSSTITNDHQSSECLYMIVTYGNPDARSMFRESDSGDVDEDGAPEFLDGWGNPIAFLRWPAGFQSELQSLNGAADPDPFDPLRVDPHTSVGPNSTKPYRLVPLIYSAGPDESYDLVSDNGDRDTNGLFSYFPINSGVLNPYKFNDNSHCMGYQQATGGYVDNIHNHLIGTN